MLKSDPKLIAGLEVFSPKGLAVFLVSILTIVI